MDEIINLREKLAKGGCDVDLCGRLVHLYRKRGELQAASDLLWNVSHACLGHGRFSSALNLMQTLLELDPDRVEVHLEVGRTHLQLGYYEKAAASFAQAFDDFLEQEKLENAREALVHLKGIQKISTIYRVREAKWLLLTGKKSEAVPALSECVKMLAAGKDSQNFSEVGGAIVMLSDLDTQASDKFGEFLADEAATFLARDQFAEAIQILCWLLKSTPKRLETYRGLVEILMQEGYGEEVLDVIDFVRQKLSDGDVLNYLEDLAIEVGAKQAVLNPEVGQVGADAQPPGGERWPFRLIADEFEGYPSHQKNAPKSEQAQRGFNQEKTSPSRVSMASERIAASKKESLWGGACVGENLLELLARINQIDALSCLNFFAHGEPEPRAELMVQNGGVLMGARVQGFSLADILDADAFKQTDVDADTLCRRWDESLRGTNYQRDSKSGVESVPDAEETRFFSLGTAYLLTQLAQIAQDTPLKLSAVAVGEESSMLQFSAPSLLIESAKMLSAQDALDGDLQLRDFGEESWVLKKIKDSNFYLPVSHSGSRLAFEELKQISLWVRELLERRQRVNQAKDAFGISFISKEAAWGALFKGQTVLVGRTSSRGIGQVLKTINTLTGA